jgi:hypothetical protein
MNVTEHMVHWDEHFAILEKWWLRFSLYQRVLHPDYVDRPCGYYYPCEHYDWENVWPGDFVQFWWKDAGSGRVKCEEMPIAPLCCSWLEFRRWLRAERVRLYGRRVA